MSISLWYKQGDGLSALFQNLSSFKVNPFPPSESTAKVYVKVVLNRAETKIKLNVGT